MIHSIQHTTMLHVYSTKYPFNQKYFQQISILQIALRPKVPWRKARVPKYFIWLYKRIQNSQFSTDRYLTGTSKTCEKWPWTCLTKFVHFNIVMVSNSLSIARSTWRRRNSVIVKFPGLSLPSIYCTQQTCSFLFSLLFSPKQLQ